ncbi:hypothetical protein ACSNOI_45560, partial [Actinomadura kijaniata]|uniref:hypothetical protein n=1 Tax=Actinomadura kijaniata TaxID=46161 RepID=UPI003F1DEF0D
MRTQVGLRKALTALKELNGLTLDAIRARSQQQLPNATTSQMINPRFDVLPPRERVELYLKAVGLSAERQQVWMQVYEWVHRN